MKKILRFLTAALLAVCLCIPAAHAAGAPSLAVSSGEVTAGGEVTLTVSVADNPGIAAVLIYIYYDTSVFTVDPDRDIAAAGSFRSGGVMGNTIALARQNGNTEARVGKDGVMAVWYNGSGMNSTGNGAVFDVTLHAGAASANGSYAIEVECSEDTCNEQLEKVAFASSSGTVTLTGGSSAPQTPPPGGPADPAPESPGSGPNTGETTNPGAPSGTNPGNGNPGNTPAPGADPARPGNSAPQRPGTQSPDNQQSPAEGEQEIQTEVQAPIQFADTDGHWAKEYIDRASAKGLVGGFNGLYRPDDEMSRAELVTILWRAGGSPVPAKEASFADLAQDWYKDAVAWAEEFGVVNGVGNGKFDPTGSVSREQLAAILHRMAGSPTGMEAMLTGVYDGQYTDSGAVSGWAKPSLYWAVCKGLYCGENALEFPERLAPRAAANRAQIAVMMVRYLDEQS